MNNGSISHRKVPQLTDGEFKAISSYVREICGLNLTDSKKSLVENRLRQRIRQLNLQSYYAYLKRLKKGDPNATKELTWFLDRVTTHTTRFFREPEQLDWIYNDLFDQLERISRNRKLRICQLGSSSGEESFTIGMMLDRYNNTHDRYINWKLIGFDISEICIKKAAKAVYKRKALDQIPEYYRKRYIQNGIGPFEDHVRIHPHIRNKISFKVKNIFDINQVDAQSAQWVICRNTLIYFDRTKKVELIRRIGRWQRPGDFLTTGLTESLGDLAIPYERIGPSTFKRVGG
ncbi:MAG: CheR family methyltransferase [Bacteroidota bacterium]